VPDHNSRSKAVAAWLAVLLGAFGAHRFYLHGWRDRFGWLFPLPALAGLVGAVRMSNLGQDDLAAAWLAPLLGLVLTVAMASALLIALAPEEKWCRRYGLEHAASNWGTTLAAIAALLIGGTALMGTIAYGGQKFFEWQLSDEPPAAGALQPAPSALSSTMPSTICATSSHRSEIDSRCS
jgi:hypothetical protein